MESLKKAEARLVQAEGALLVAILTVMAALAVLQVLLRQFFSTGLLWADTLSRHLVLWVGFLGAAVAAAEGKHFAWEAASHAPGRRGTLMRLAANLLAAAACWFLMRAALEFLHEERAAETVLFTAFGVPAPAWAFAVIVPLGFGLVLLHSLLRALLAAAELKGAARP